MKKKRYDLAFVYAGIQNEGLQLIKEMRAGKFLSALPVIVYSGDVSKENVIAAAEAGANSFLAYPFSVSDVESALKMAMRGAATNP